MNIEQSEETVLKMNRIQKPSSESTIPSLFFFYFHLIFIYKLYCSWSVTFQY